MSENFLDIVVDSTIEAGSSLLSTFCDGICFLGKKVYDLLKIDSFYYLDNNVLEAKCVDVEGNNKIIDSQNAKYDIDKTFFEIQNVKKYDYIPTELYNTDFRIKNDEEVKIYQYIEGEKKGVRCGVGVDILGNPFKFDILNGHTMVGGASRWGKSNFLNVFITGTMLTYTPNEVMFLGCDYKKSDIYYFRNFEHFRGMATNKKEFITLIKALEKEMDKRADILDKANCRNVIKYNKVSDKKLSYIVFIIDELVLLANDKSEPAKVDCKTLLHSVMAKSASYGIYFILASQDFTKDTIGKCKMNCSQTVGFRTKDKTDSETIIGKDHNLHEITERGRCKIDSGGEVTEVQIYFIEEEEMENILKPYRKVEKTSTVKEEKVAVKEGV